MRRYPEYKESGVEWIGEIPAHFEVKRLKYVVDLNMGQSPPSEEYNTDSLGTPFLQGNADFGPHHPTPKIYCPTARKHAIPGDILLSVRAPVGAINTADQPYGIGRGLCAIRPRTNHLERRYAKYLLEVVRTELYVVAIGTTYDAVTVNDISNITCVVPPLSEQIQIADFLDRKTGQIDELIRIKERQIELLQEKRTVLINQVVTKGLAPNVEMKPSGVEWIGEIPAHWEVIRNKFIFQQIRDIGYPNLPLLSIGIKGIIPKSQTDQKDVSSADKSLYKRVKIGDIAFNVMTVWKGGLGMSDYEGIVSPAYQVCRSAIKLVSKYFHYLFRTDLYKAIFDMASYRVVDQRHNLYYDNFKNISAIFPPFSEQKQIVNFLDCKTGQIDELIAIEGRKVELLKEYRQSLIFEAVTGKIDVRGGDAVTESSAV